MKAKSSKQPRFIIDVNKPILKGGIRELIKAEPQFYYDKGYEQGKKDAEKKCPYATGIPPYFKKAKEKCIVVIGERDIIRKQTLEEVLKDVDEAFFKERGDWDSWFDEHNKKRSDKDVYIENIETLQRVIDDITKRLDRKVKEVSEPSGSDLEQKLKAME